MAPEMTKAISLTLKGLIPTDFTLSSFSLHDFKTNPISGLKLPLMSTQSHQPSKTYKIKCHRVHCIKKGKIFLI